MFVKKVRAAPIYDFYTVPAILIFVKYFFKRFGLQLIILYSIKVPKFIICCNSYALTKMQDEQATPAGVSQGYLLLFSSGVQQLPKAEQTWILAAGKTWSEAITSVNKCLTGW